MSRDGRTGAPLLARYVIAIARIPARERWSSETARKLTAGDLVS